MHVLWEITFLGRVSFLVWSSSRHIGDWSQINAMLGPFTYERLNYRHDSAICINYGILFWNWEYVVALDREPHLHTFVMMMQTDPILRPVYCIELLLPQRFHAKYFEGRFPEKTAALSCWKRWWLVMCSWWGVTESVWILFSQSLEYGVRVAVIWETGLFKNKIFTRAQSLLTASGKTGAYWSRKSALNVG